jgi:hypothetical protein
MIEDWIWEKPSAAFLKFEFKSDPESEQNRHRDESFADV